MGRPTVAVPSVQTAAQINRLCSPDVNTLNAPGFPPFDLRLKKGAPIVLLRNLNASEKLCNGTRLIVDDVINGRLIKATIVSTGRQVLIPRIGLKPKAGKFPFTFTRRQFPVRVAFAMTINKSQGQTMSRVGVLSYTVTCFGHGQLYVAASRVTRPAGILVPPGRETRNVVYREALLPGGPAVAPGGGGGG